MAKNLIKIQVKAWNGFGTDHIPQSKKSGRRMFAVFQNMDQKRALVRMDDPVFSHARFLVHLIFVLQLLAVVPRSEEHTSELQSRENLVRRLRLDKTHI